MTNYNKRQHPMINEAIINESGNHYPRRLYNTQRRAIREGYNSCRDLGRLARELGADYEDKGRHGNEYCIFFYYDYEDEDEEEWYYSAGRDIEADFCDRLDKCGIEYWIGAGSCGDSVYVNIDSLEASKKGLFEGRSYNGRRTYTHSFRR